MYGGTCCNDSIQMYAAIDQSIITGVIKCIYAWRDTGKYWTSPEHSCSTNLPHIPMEESHINNSF